MGAGRGIQFCPSCKGRGFKRDVDGEALECPVCHGEGMVDAFVCDDPETAWIEDQRA